MSSIIVADTGPLIAFAYLDLFAIFPNVLVPDIVIDELDVDPLKPDAVSYFCGFCCLHNA